MPIPSFVASFATQKVTVHDLATGKLKPVVLIDVRSPDEYARDRIGHSLLVPLAEIQSGEGIQKIQEIAEQVATLSAPQQPVIVLYCSICPGAIHAYQKLRALGLNLMVLYGGITAWRQAIPATKDAEVLAPIAFSKNLKVA